MRGRFNWVLSALLTIVSPYFHGSSPMNPGYQAPSLQKEAPRISTTHTQTRIRLGALHSRSGEDTSESPQAIQRQG